MRPRASAKKYAAIWTPEGSPLAIESEALRRGLEAFLRPHDTPVALAMLYTGGASVPDAIASLRKAGAEGILTIPMFPQYCGASTGAVFDQVSAALACACAAFPSLRFVSSYHDDAAYIDALAESVQDHRRDLMGPRATCSCRFTAYPSVTSRWEILTAINASAPPAWWRNGSGSRRGEWSVSFQSRFGRARWLQPYTSEVLAAMPARGVKSVSVICPGFAADCLETLEEIGMENRDVFLAAGGEKYHYIAALNARADHVAALGALVSRELGASHPAAARESSACSG